MPAQVNNLTQTELKEQYSDLIYKLDCGIPTSIIDSNNILKTLKLNEGKNTISIDTNIAPSKMEITYNSK